MSKICAKCDKPVYPLEELKCLDKIWHKGCFKCWDCGMSLSMKNYKGFDRKPYCSAHYPQTKATVVADTPEQQRLSQTSKLQSQTAYHDDFEKSKGKYTQIADDPELLRLVRNQEAVSTVVKVPPLHAKYHEEFEKKIKGSKIEVADDPETQRLKQLSSIVSQVEYKGLREKVMDMEARRQNVSQPEVPEKSSRRPTSGGPDDYAKDGQRPSPYSDRNISHSVTYCADGKVESQPQQRKIGLIADYDPMNFSSTLPHSALRQTQEWEETVVMSPSANNPSMPHREPPSSTGGYQFTSLERPSAARSGGSPAPGLGKPLVTVEHAALYQGDSVTRERALAPSLQAEDQQYLMQQQQQQQQQQQLRQQEVQEQKLRQQQQVQQQQQLQQEQLRQQQLKQQQLYNLPYEQPVQHVQRPSAIAGAIFQAMYDYDAQDEDEVSFVENDLVINCDPIDEGWMFGTIKRTGQRGMLPANYVERVQ